MTTDPQSTSPASVRKPLLIENIYEKETSESFVERHFRHRTLHRCRFAADFDVDAIAREYASDLVRSGQELEQNPKGVGLVPQWTMLIFKRPENVMWHFLIKSSGSFGEKANLVEYNLTVTAETPSAAAADALWLQKNYTVNDSAPGFFMLQDIKKPRRIALKPEYALTESMLEMHYGEGFAEWSKSFGAGLAQSGLSILRGSPGTGKTSYLRHLIYTLSETHRFYYIPVDAFHLLQAQIVGFLTKERNRYPDHVLVLVMEDAEQLLIDRKGHRNGLASSLLNFSDGFVGDIVSAHMICTINSEIKDLDDAVLRPGRQRFFREFHPLPTKQAAILAAELGIELKEQRAHTLAELYHFQDLQKIEAAKKPSPKPIGFGSA